MTQIRLSQGLYALVCERDYAWLNQWKWSASQESNGKKWYAVRYERSGGKTVKIRMHRAVVEKHHGPIPPGMVIDHLNDNSLDNRGPNLEAKTQTANMHRCPGWRKKGIKCASKTEFQKSLGA